MTAAVGVPASAAHVRSVPAVDVQAVLGDTGWGAITIRFARAADAVSWRSDVGASFEATIAVTPLVASQSTWAWLTDLTELGSASAQTCPVGAAVELRDGAAAPAVARQTATHKSATQAPLQGIAVLRATWLLERGVRIG